MKLRKFNPLSAEMILHWLGSLLPGRVFASPKAMGYSHRLPGGVNKIYHPVNPVNPVGHNY
jgi:hypothetical protein